MQIDDKHIDELFAHKLRNMEATPPEDGWSRIENELDRRSRITRKFWLAAASFALVLSVTAAVVFMQTSVVPDDAAGIAAMESTSQQQSGMPQLKHELEKDILNQGTIQPEMRQSRNERSQDESFSSARVEENHISTGSSVSLNETVTTAMVETGIQVSPQDNTAISDNAKPLSNHPVYVESWDEMLRVKPLESKRFEFLTSKNIQPEKTVFDNNEGNTSAIVTSNIPVYDDLAYIDVTNNSTKSRPINRWEIKGQIAPGYSYRAISSVPGGLRKSDFNDAESPLMVYSGGISVSYMIYGRFSLQMGLLYSQMGQSINNVTPVTSMFAAVSSNNSYTKNFVRTSSGSVTVASNMKSDVNTSYASYFNAESQSTAVNNMSMANAYNTAKYRLIERIDYLEIPLMLRYKLIDRKLNLYLLGGMSTNILVGNNVFVDNGSELVKGGTTLMARPVNYSSTLGLGLGYQVSGNLSVGLEPSFKYYLQPYTTSSQIGSNPYAFGLYTGIFYRF